MLAIAVILQIFIFGFLSTYFFKLKLFLENRIFVGIILGFVWFGYLMLLLTYFLGQNLASLGLFILITYLFIVSSFTVETLKKIKEDTNDLYKRSLNYSWRYFWVCLLLFIILFGHLAGQLFTFNQGKYFVSPVHSYGDISLHLSIVSSFAFATNIPPQSPILSNTPISYPFLVDYITSLFINPLGFSLETGFYITEVLLMISLIVIFSYFVNFITKSKLTAIIALTLFFFNGGLGFIYVFQDYQNGQLDLLSFLQHLPRDYTSIKEIGYWWINVVLSMLLPQRSFLLGFPLALIILQIFWDAYLTKTKSLILGFLLMGLLPLVHPHSLVAISIFVLLVIVHLVRKSPKEFKYIFMLGLLSFLIALFLSRTFLQQSHSMNLISVHLGWMAHGENLINFYFKNFGIILFVLPLFIFLARKQKLPFINLILLAQFWFIIPSLFIFQPWDFDNIKLLIYWYALSVIVVAYYFAKFIVSKKPLIILVALFSIVLMSLSGALDILRMVLSSDTKFEVYSKQAIKAGEFVRGNTSRSATFISVDKFDNPAVTLAGRKSVLGYKTWAWSYGLDYSQREKDINEMLNGSDKSLFEKYRVTHIILFNEPTQVSINREYFQKHYKLIYNLDGYEIYEI